jgi:hypothetical protein
MKLHMADENISTQNIPGQPTFDLSTPELIDESASNFIAIYGRDATYRVRASVAALRASAIERAGGSCCACATEGLALRQAEAARSIIPCRAACRS